MITIDNMTIKEYFRDRTFIFFKPLIDLLAYKKSFINEQDNSGETYFIAEMTVFSDKVIDTIKKHNSLHTPISNTTCSNDLTHSVNLKSLFNNTSIEILKNKSLNA